MICFFWLKKLKFTLKFTKTKERCLKIKSLVGSIGNKAIAEVEKGCVTLNRNMQVIHEWGEEPLSLTKDYILKGSKLFTPNGELVASFPKGECHHSRLCNALVSLDGDGVATVYTVGRAHQLQYKDFELVEFINGGFVFSYTQWGNKKRSYGVFLENGGDILAPDDGEGFEFYRILSKGTIGAYTSKAYHLINLANAEISSRPFSPEDMWDYTANGSPSFRSTSRVIYDDKGQALFNTQTLPHFKYGNGSITFDIDGEFINMTLGEIMSLGYGEMTSLGVKNFAKENPAPSRYSYNGSSLKGVKYTHKTFRGETRHYISFGDILVEKATGRVINNPIGKFSGNIYESDLIGEAGELQLFQDPTWFYVWEPASDRIWSYKGRFELIYEDSSKKIYRSGEQTLYCYQNKLLVLDGAGWKRDGDFLLAPNQKLLYVPGIKGTGVIRL